VWTSRLFHWKLARGSLKSKQFLFNQISFLPCAVSKIRIFWSKLEQVFTSHMPSHHCQSTNTHTHTQPFYGHFSRTTRVSRCQKRTSGLMVQGEINRGRHTDHPAGCLSIRTNQYFFMGRMPFLPPSPNQQRQSSEGSYRIQIREKTLEFSSSVLPAPSPYHTERNWKYWKPSREYHALDLIFSWSTNWLLIEAMPQTQIPTVCCQ